MNNKRIKCQLAIFASLLLSIVITSCSKSDETPEISIPSGSENYFLKSMDFDSSESEKSLTFKTNVSWNISVSDTRSGSNWLSVSPISGDAGTNTVTVKASENTTYDDRNAVITITAGDSIRRVFVNQKQMNALTLTSDRFEVPVSGGTVDVEVKANVEYVITVPEKYKDWIVPMNNKTRGLTSTIHTFNIGKSEEYEKREGQILITSGSKEEVVNIYQAGEGILTLTKNEFRLNSSAQEFTIEINSNFDYDVEMPSVDWIKENKSNTRGISTHTLRLAIDENTDYDERMASIRIYDRNGSTSETVTVIQEQKDGLFVDNKAYEVANEGGIVEVEVRTNTDYEVIIAEEAKEWIHKSEATTRGLTVSTVHLTIDKSNEYGTREGQVLIKNTSTNETIVITQEGTPIIDVPKTDYLVNSKSQTLTIDVNSNFVYAVELSDANWISIADGSKTRALSANPLQLNIAENSEYEDRTAKIKLYDKESEVSVDITITQSQKSELIIDNKEYVIDENGGTFEVNVNSNVAYEIIIDANWISEVAGTRGLTTKTHKFKVEPLDGKEGRTATVSFVDNASGQEDKVLVSQNRTIFFDEEEITLMEGAQKKLNLTNRSQQTIVWDSSNKSVATVDENGLVTAVGKGTATITAKTTDGLHSCTCGVNVSSITDFITARAAGGAISQINDLIQYGSSLGWTFINNSSESVKLLSMQLIDGANGREGNIMDVNVMVAGGESVSYSTTVGLMGIHAPVTCRFRYEFNGKEYSVDAVFKSLW